MTWTTVKGWETQPEQGLLAAFTKQIQPDGIYVEIGSEHGMSASIVLKNGWKNNVQIYCVEINPDAEFEANIAGAGLDTHSLTAIYGDSKKVDIPDEVVSRGIDLLFVDGDHTKDGAKADLMRWSEFVKWDGVIMVHDCACSTNKNPHHDHYAVLTAVHEFLATKPGAFWRVAFTVDSMMVLVRQ